MLGKRFAHTEIAAALSDVGIDPTVEHEFLARGYSSEVVRAGAQVAKILKVDFNSFQEAEGHVETLAAEQSRITHYMGSDSVALTQFFVTQAMEGSPRVILLQPWIAGMTIRKALSNSNVEPTDITEYLSKAWNMYKVTRKIPDLACIDLRFDPLSDSNTQIVVTENEAKPKLVDTTFGRTQRKPRLGQVMHTSIALGVRRALVRLS